jgi:hypothetical protein
MTRHNNLLALTAVLAVAAGRLSAQAAEPDAAAVMPSYRPSIPAAFLEAGMPFDPAQARPVASRPSVAPQPLPQDDFDAAITAQVLKDRNRVHHISTLPPEEMLGDLEAMMPSVPQQPGLTPSPAEEVAARLQAAPPSSGHRVSNLPFDPAAFPLYHPGLTPPQYPGEQVQFQQPAPNPFAPDAYGGVPMGAIQQRRAEVIEQRQESFRAAWVATAEAVFLTESSTLAGPALVQNTATQATLLSVPQITDSWGMGPRLTLTRNRSENVSFDFGFLGIYNWDRDVQVLGDNNLRLAGPIALATVDFFAADAMSIMYRTNITSLESNIIFTPDWVIPVGSFVVGSRYIYWRETFDIQATDFDAGTSDYEVRVANRMYGTQIGWNGEIDSPIGGALFFKLRGGIFANHSSQAQSIRDFDNTFELRNTGASGNRTSYLGETSIVQSYNPMRGLDVRFGYTLMWINGLTRAPDQVDMSDTATSGSALIDSGHIFMHGFNLTVAYGW